MSTGRGAIAGFVFDSLVANAPLAGAEVVVEGTELSAATDPLGRFRINGVPPGRHVLRFFHERLDSLGFGAAPIAVAVGDSGTVGVALGTPSAATLHARLCPGPQGQSTGVLLGQIRDVDTRASLPNATITANWSEWTLGTGALVRTERRAAATADASGAYVLCGVPTDVSVVARAVSRAHLTGLVEVDFARRPFDVRDFAVSLTDSAATAAHLAHADSAIARGDSVSPTGSATVTGVVRAPDQKPLADAQVAVFGIPISVRTNSDGVYSLTGVPAGSQTVEVRAVGFAPQRFGVELATGQRRALDVTTSRTAQALAPVNIVGRGARVDMTGFEERRLAGLGHFIGPEEIERRRVFDTSQLLWNVPGSRVIWNGSENVVMFTRPNVTGSGPLVDQGKGVMEGGSYNTLCNPAVFIDGYQVYDINDVRPYAVRGIEVYRDQSAAPPEYRASSLKDSGRPTQHCAVVLVWTKPPEPKRQSKR